MENLTTTREALPTGDSVAETLRALLSGETARRIAAAVLRAAGYTRVSSQMQLEEGSSIEDQETRIREHIEKEKWIEVDIISDPAQSGRSGNRPGFQRLQRLVRNQKVDVIVVDRLDRISRNLFTLLNFIKLLNDHDVKLISLREQIDFSTIWGRLVLYILGALAEFYSSVLSQEIRLQRYHAARDGRLSGAFRFGYCKGNCSSCTDPNGKGYCPAFGGPDRGDGRIRVDHPVEFHAVRSMYEWYATGQYSYDDVARRVNSEIFVLPDGTEVRLRTKGRPGRCPPQPFDKDAVRTILSNPIYAGIVTYAGSDAQGNKRRKPVEFFKGKHPAAVDMILFRRVQRIRRNRDHRSQSLRSKARTYPLSGIVFCAPAHSPMRVISSGGGEYCYHSDKLCRQRLPKDKWHQPNVKMECLVEQVQALVTRMMLPQAWRDRILTYVIYNDGIAEMEQEKFLIRQRLHRASKLYLDGEYTRGQFERIRAACHRDLAILVPMETPIGQEAITILDDLAALWEVLTDDELNTLHRLLINGVYTQGKTIAEIEPRASFRAPLKKAAARLTEETGSELSYKVVDVASEPDEEIVALLNRS